MNANGELRGVEAFNIALRYYDIGHAKFLRLADALLYARHRAYFAGKAHLAGHAPASRYYHVDVARQYRGYYGKVKGRVVHFDTACNVEKHVLGSEFEANALFEHGEEHVDALGIIAGNRPLRVPYAAVLTRA